MSVKTEANSESSELLARVAVGLAIDKKAEKIVMLNPGKGSSLADWFIVCESDNTVHNSAIAASIIDGLREHGVHLFQKEGVEDGRWVLLDYADVVVNVMLPEVREMYDLEGIFKDYPRIDIDEKTFVAPVIE